jgi:hypothetical protein
MTINFSILTLLHEVSLIRNVRLLLDYANPDFIFSVGLLNQIAPTAIILWSDIAVAVCRYTPAL